MGGDAPWDSVSTFPTREECAMAMHQQAQALERMGLRVTEDPGASFEGAAQELKAVRRRGNGFGRIHQLGRYETR
jgi:hypothetical protein